jgi:hypothetical protein
MFVNSRLFLRAFGKILKSDYKLRHVCLSVCLPAWNNSATSGRIFAKADILIFKKKKSVDKIQNSLKADKNNRHFT